MPIELAIQMVVLVLGIGSAWGVSQYRHNSSDKRFKAMADYLKEFDLPRLRGNAETALKDGSHALRMANEGSKERSELKTKIAELQEKGKADRDRVFSLESTRTFMEDRLGTMHSEIKVLQKEDDHLGDRLDSLSAELKAAEGRIISRIDQLANGRDHRS